MADYFFRRNDFPEAEQNYKLLFQNWKSSELAYQARLMAGRAAMHRPGYPDAIEHFTGLTIKPIVLLIYGEAHFSPTERADETTSAATNRFAGYAAAIRVFGK